MEQGQLMRVFAPLQRVDDEARMVYGVFVSDTPVKEYGEEVVLDWEATRAAVEAWRAWGNIREMHKLVAAGVAREITLDDTQHVGRVGAYIVDDPAWQKVKAGAYKGFSVGVNPTRWEIGAERGDPVRVTEYEIVEVSLVDRPKDPTSVIEVWRAAGGPETGTPWDETLAAVLRRVMGEFEAQRGGAKVSVLEQVWAMAMGDTATLPEAPEEALELLRAALTPEAVSPPEPAMLPDELQRVMEAHAQTSNRLAAQGAELTVLRGDVDGQVQEVRKQVESLARALSAAIERVQVLEESPVEPSVQRRGSEPEQDVQGRITELERVIRTGRGGRPLAPESPEVQELARLYQQRRK